MSNMKTIASLLKRLRYATSGGAGDSARSPMRDWLTMLIAGAIAFAGIVVWNAWAFDTVTNGDAIGEIATSTQPVFDTSSIDAIHKIFSSRAAEEAKYRTGIYRYADPSQ